MIVRNPYYRMDDWNVRDDLTGFKRKRSECRLTWNNFLVAKEQWEPRQPQDYVRGRKDDQTVPLARPGWTSDTATFHAAGSVTRDDF